jgi:hypothetical protein
VTRNRRFKLHGQLGCTPLLGQLAGICCCGWKIPRMFVFLQGSDAKGSERLNGSSGVRWLYSRIDAVVIHTRGFTAWNIRSLTRSNLEFISAIALRWSRRNFGKYFDWSIFMKMIIRCWWPCSKKPLSACSVSCSVYRLSNFGAHCRQQLFVFSYRWQPLIVLTSWYRYSFSCYCRRPSGSCKQLRY